MCIILSEPTLTELTLPKPIRTDWNQLPNDSSNSRLKCHGCEMGLWPEQSASTKPTRIWWWPARPHPTCMPLVFNTTILVLDGPHKKANSRINCIYLLRIWSCRGTTSFAIKLTWRCCQRLMIWSDLPTIRIRWFMTMSIVILNLQRYGIEVIIKI